MTIKTLKNIKMDDVMTAEIDFSGLHIVILYAQEGINYWAEINEDPYLLSGINDIDPDINLRRYEILIGLIISVVPLHEPSSTLLRRFA